MTLPPTYDGGRGVEHTSIPVIAEGFCDVSTDRFPTAPLSDSEVTGTPEKSSGETPQDDDSWHEQELDKGINTIATLDALCNMDKISPSALALHTHKIAVGWHELNTTFGTRLTPEEREQGFRMLVRPDTTYLGFFPSKSDTRRFLAAMALVTAEPELSFALHFPMAPASRFCFVVFVLVTSLAVAGAAYYVLVVDGSLG